MKRFNVDSHLRLDITKFITTQVPFFKSFFLIEKKMYQMTKRQKIPQQFYKKKSFLKKLFLLNKKKMFVMIKGRKCPNNLIKKTNK